MVYIINYSKDYFQKLILAFGALNFIIFIIWIITLIKKDIIWIIISSTILIIGAVGFIGAIIGEYLHRILEQSKAKPYTIKEIL